MSHVFHRSLTSAPPVAVAGEGIHVIDAEGRRYIDACGGAAVSCLGHGHPAIKAAIRDQLDRLEYVHTGFFGNEPMEALADELIAHAPAGMTRVWFTSGGSEAIESALKLVRQYFLEIGEPERTQVIARCQSYHGNTLGALAVGGNIARREPYDPLLFDGVHHIAPCYAYRDRRADESEAEYGQRVAGELEARILDLGPGKVAAFVAEPVVGATLGAAPPVEGYFARIREICDRHGVLFVADEVMCGMGRTGTLHALEQDGVAPDVLVVAKGLGGGFQPVGAVLIRDMIVDAITRGSGSFQHGLTYAGHAVACAAALAVQRTIREEGLLSRVRDAGSLLRSRLDARFGNHSHVGDVRGRGLLLGLEMVEDRSSKEPFDPGLALNVRIKKEALARGLMVYPMGGTIDGRRGDHVVLAPPYTVTDDEVVQIVDLLGEAVDAAVVRLPV